MASESPSQMTFVETVEIGPRGLMNSIGVLAALLRFESYANNVTLYV
jgi:hypothetical protein